MTRDAQIDHYKFFLIACIVFGHLIEPAIARAPVAGVYNFIYLFHIPAFVFIAGLFTRTDKTFPRTAQFLILLVIFQTLYLLYGPLIGAEPWPPLRPYWILWFLMAMVWWTLAAPLFKKLPGALILAVLLALGAGAVEAIGYRFAGARTLYFLPFFVAGLCHGEWLIAQVKGRKVAGVIGVAFSAAILFACRDWISAEFLYGANAYADLGQDFIAGAAVRAGLLALSFLALLSFIPLMPTTPGYTARIGAHTLAIFMVHGFIVLALRPVMEELFAQSVAGGFAASALLTLALVTALARPGLTALLNAPGRFFTK